MSNEYLANVLFLPGYHLSIPKLIFRGDAPALTTYYGLTIYGPYELPSNPPKTVVLLHPNTNDFRELSLKIKSSLENGYKRYFPEGFSSIFDIDVEFETVAIDRYDMYRSENTAEEYFRKFSDTCKDIHGNINECFPVIIMNKVPRGLYESLYTEVKYKFTTEGIPSQVVTYETFSNENLFKWSIFPLALQIFVKMGGTPFLLYDRLNIPEDEVAMIIGLGLSRIKLQTKELRYVGFALAFEASGRWRLIKWSPQPYSRSMLPHMLKTLIHDVVDEVLSNYAIEKPNKIHVLIHYSGKNISVAEEDSIREACQEIKQVQDIDVMPYVVKIQESMYRLYDENNLCVDSSDRPTHLVNVGTVIKMKKDLYILHTTGCVTVQTGQGNVKYKPNAQGSPSPLIVSIKRLEGTQYELNDIELVKSVLYMARMNYASINNPVSKLPISIKYSRMLAYITAKLAYKVSYEGEGNIDTIVPQKLKQRLWFI